MKHAMLDIRATAGRMGARMGIVLLEVLLAAAILAAAALALATLADRCVARDAAGEGLLAASRTAENLVADADMRQDLRAGFDQGPVAALSGATYTRQVMLIGSAAGVYRILVVVSYDAGGQSHKFSLEKLVMRSHEK